MRRRAQHALAAEAADEDEQSFQDEVLFLHLDVEVEVKNRGRPRVAEAQEIEPKSTDEPIALEVDPTAFAAGMTDINQGLTTLN